MTNATSTQPFIKRLRGKRGRPGGAVREHDSGTPELVHKKSYGLTTEPLDTYFEYGFLTADQHWCGIHLRWLYTLRYGVPGVSAIDPTHLGGRTPQGEDTAWNTEREREYLEAMHELGKHKLAMHILAICVHNQPICFPHGIQSLISGRHHIHNRPLSNLRFGLELLRHKWCC